MRIGLISLVPPGIRMDLTNYMPAHVKSHAKRGSSKLGARHGKWMRRPGGFEFENGSSA
jgi:hypothetical protein